MRGASDRRLNVARWLIALCVVLAPRIASAQYIDPGNASLYWQLLLSAIAGFAFTFRGGLTWLFHAVRRRLRGERPDSQ